MENTITIREYSMLDNAFRHFNQKLFDGELPEVLVTLNRKKGANGYYWHDKFQNRETGDSVAEICLNPDNFEGRSDKEILSTLGHEMVHLWEYFITDGNPSRPGYHNKVWAKKMQEIGLMPSSTGEVGGKVTGQRMTHYIIDGGQFDIHADAFLLSNKIGVQSSPEIAKERAARKKTRLKYTCPDCLTNIWAKPNTVCLCGVCDGNPQMIVEEE